MSRNNDKLVGTLPDDSLPIMSQDNSNSQLNFITPTQLVDLPSKGRFYPDGHPLKDKEDVEMLFMSAKSEDILTNKSFIKKGVAIDRMLSSLLVDKNLDLDSLLIGDKNAMIIEARISGYGSEYKTKFTCPTCGESQDYEFDLDTAKKINFGEDVEEVSEVTAQGTFVVTLPRSKALVECKLLTGKDEKELAFLQEKKKKHNLPDSLMTDQLKMFIVAVNGDSSKEKVSRAVETMPAIDSRWLRSVYKKVNPNMTLKQEFTCKACASAEEVDVLLGTSFFWPN
jgi:transcription elongation factor Elf1